MGQLETEHYVFHYAENSTAHREISSIAACQEGCFRHICQVLRTVPEFKIHYYLCQTPEEVGCLYGDNEPCNGFARMPDKIYAVYNEQVRCIGFHEDAHIISYTLCKPEPPAVREGLAMYFDRCWWGISNLAWSRYFQIRGQAMNVAALLNRDVFFAGDCAVTYPTMGAFTEYLIAAYGMDKYLEFYRQPDMSRIFGRSSEELNAAFWQYVSLFSIDTGLEARMEELSRK